LDLIRKVLILSLNTDWARDLSHEFSGSKKIAVRVGSTRSGALKHITEEKFTALVIEDTFTKKNIDYLLRALVSQNVEQPSYIFLCFLDFNLFREISIPEGLKAQIVAHSYPMAQAEMAKIIGGKLLKCSVGMGLQDCSKEIMGIDLEFANVFMKATTKTLSEFGVMENITHEKPFMLQKAEGDLGVKIRGKIIIKSEFFSGSFLVSFPKETYLTIYNKVAQAEKTEIDDSNYDFAGEMANMIYGQAKKVLSEQGVNLDMAIPVSDKADSIVQNDPIVVVPFSSSIGKFYIKLARNFY